MRSQLWLMLLLGTAGMLSAQDSSTNPGSGNPGSGASQSDTHPTSSQAPATAGQNTKSPTPDSSPLPTAPNPRLAPPRSDKIDAGSIEDGESSSKDTRVDLSPPEDDAKTHPRNSEVLVDESDSGSGDVAEFHPWDPHRAAKDVEVGDYYFKRKNYKGAESRYREALLYKDNDAVATFRLAVCLEKLERPDEARVEYENYLKILPHGPDAEAAQKAVDRLKGTAASVKPAK